jgi:hypothetical protein
MTEHPYTDSDGRQYRYEVVWFTNSDGRMDCELKKIYLPDLTEMDEMDTRVFYDEDIARILNWFDYEEIFNGYILDFWMCNDCGEFFDSEPTIYNDDNVCEGCIEDNYVTCGECGELLHENDGHFIESEDMSVCDGCYDEKFTTCADCGERYRRDNMRSDDNIYICNDCGQNWFRCDDCGYLVHCDDMYSNDNGCYCEDCYCNHHHDEDDLCDMYGIHEYGYRPDMLFKGEGNLYFGTEMEIDGGDFDKFRFSDLNEDMFYPCSDGSLDDGFEIISHPMTYEWIMENTPYHAICEMAKEANFKSHNTTTCGFHIHMSRRAFGNPFEDATNNRITSFIYFFEKFWKEVVIFSRRKHDFNVFSPSINAIDHYAARILDFNEPVDYKTVDTKKKDKAWDRYHCVNLSNSATIEVRIFRGTLNPQTIIASIQLCKLFFELSVFDVATIEHMTWAQIKAYAETDYPELLKYMATRNL